MDLRDLWRPGGGQSRLTWRLLGNLLRYLPPESATKTALRNAMEPAEAKRDSEAADPSQGQWSQTEMLLALLIDAVRQLTYTTLRMQIGKKAGKPPEPIPRPGVPSRSRRRGKTLSEQQAQFLYRWINGPDAQ